MITGRLILKIIIDGKPHQVVKDLPEAARSSSGPMSLESGCLLALREACQEIWGEVRRED
jgi:hypothetical protein